MNTFACSVTPDQKLKALKTTMDAEKIACGAYLLDPKIPKDESVTDYCMLVVNGCPKLVIQSENRSVCPN